MLINPVLLTIVSFLPFARSHFRIPFPGERDPNNWSTQEEGPCGGDNEVVTPRYEWNPHGSPLEVTLHHQVSIGAIYYCPGDSCHSLDDFNVTLFETWDVYGTGNYCMTSIDIPYEVGSVGTVQVVTTSAGESAGEYEEFFNCVDIVISNNGPLYNGSQCSNTSGIDISPYEVNNDRLYNATNISAIDSYFESTQTASSSNSSSAGALSSSSSLVSSSSNSTSSLEAAGAKFGVSSTLAVITGILLLCL